jgi:hypothetical protein
MKWTLVFAYLIFASLLSSQGPSFSSRYTRVESYEIRPGVLATPVYSANGALCQVSFEQSHVQKDAVHLQTEMPHDLVLEIINELAPPEARGKPKWHIGEYEYLDLVSGTSTTSVAEYDNVSVQIFQTESVSGDAAVIIEWKNACTASKNDKLLIK